MLSVQDQIGWDTRLRSIQEAQKVGNVSTDAMRRDKVEPVDFFRHFKSLNDKLLERQASLWRGYYMTWLRSALYYCGHQILVPRGTFGYDIRQLRGIDQPLYVYNKLRPYSDTVTDMWVGSSPETLFAVLDEDERKAERAIDELQTLNAYFNRLHLTEENLQLIAKGGQLCGNYHFEHWYDPDDRNGYEWFEEYAPLELPGAMWQECLDCGDVGEAQENAACLTCGSPAVSPVPMPGVRIDDALLADQGWKQSGEVVMRPFPAWSLRYSLTTGPADSPWRYAEEDLPKEQIEAVYGKLDGTADDERWGRDEAMHAERVMRRAARQRGGGVETGEDDSDNALVQRFWYRPEMLAFYSLKAPVTLPDGETIPAGERLADAFPGGMCILTAPGLPNFLNVYREDHGDRFTDGRYGIVFGQQVGAGIEDGVEAQRQTNVLKSGTFRYLQKTLQPSIAVNGRVFQDSRLFNRLDNVISINNATLPEGTQVGHHFAHVVPPGINPQVFGYLQDMDAEIQQALKAYSSQGDFPGVPNWTATASKIRLSKSQAAHNTYLAIYAGVLKEASVKRLLLAQKHYGDLRLVHDVDRLTGERQARQVRAVSIRTNFIAWVKPGSFMPNLEIEKRAAVMEGAQVVSILQPLSLLNPSSLRQINEIFKTDFTFERQREKLEECEEVIDLMLQAAEAAGGQIAPEQLYALSPVNPYTLGHDVKIHYYRDWLGSAEGRGAPEAVQQAVIIRIHEHYSALINEQVLMAQAAAAGPMAVQSQQMGQQMQMNNQNGKAGVDAKPQPVPERNPMAAEPQAAMPSPNPMLGY